jgi:hypothetical protein
LFDVTGTKEERREATIRVPALTLSVPPWTPATATLLALVVGAMPVPPPPLSSRQDLTRRDLWYALTGSEFPAAVPKHSICQVMPEIKSKMRALLLLCKKQKILGYASRVRCNLRMCKNQFFAKRKTWTR